MCLSIPGRIIEKEGDAARVDVDGNVVEASLMLIEDAEVGDFVLVHAGVAIEKYEEEDALETIRVLREALGDAPEPE